MVMERQRMDATKKVKESLQEDPKAEIKKNLKFLGRGTQ